MNRLTLRTQLQVSGFGNTTAEQTSQDEWLRAAYEWVWAQADWQFKKADRVNVTITAGDSTPAMPSFVGHVDDIYDQDGKRLERMDETDFNERYQPDVVDSVTGAPEAWKIDGVTGEIVLGPVPSANATFTADYDYRPYHLASDGTTKDGGYLDADTDIPAWGYPDGDHHMILVYHAAMVGHALRSNPAAVTMQGLRDDALESMIEQYGRDPGLSEYGREES